MLTHYFDRFHVVTKFILPSIGDLNFQTLNYDNTCAHLDSKNVCNTHSKKHMFDLMTFCKNIEPFCALLQKTNNITQQHHP